MIRGIINPRHEAIVPLLVRGPGGAQASIEAILDTGFSGSLTLPATTIASLGLVSLSNYNMVLADGSLTPIDFYQAELLWDGNWQSIIVSAIGNEPLLGMQILNRHELRIVVVTGGMVEITPLP